MATVQSQSAQDSTVQKFSRYRSVRKANNSITSPTSPPHSLPIQELNNESLARSKSRYRKKKPLSESPSPPLPNINIYGVNNPAKTARALPRMVHSHSASLAALNGELYNESSTEQTTTGGNGSSGAGVEATKATTKTEIGRSPKRSDSTTASPYSGKVSSRNGRPPKTWTAIQASCNYSSKQHGMDVGQDARDILAAEHTRMRQMKAQEVAARDAERVKRRADLTSEKNRAEQSRLERNARSEAQKVRQDQFGKQQVAEQQFKREQTAREKARKPRSAPGTGVTGSATHSGPLSIEVQPSREKVADFPHKALQSVDKVPAVSRVATIRKKFPSLSRLRSNEPVADFAKPRNIAMGPPLPRKPPSAETIEATVNRDAPVSAVNNAGDRRVKICYGSSAITLPVTPSTTPQDLLNSASTVMSDSINPRTSVLKECFVELGLERALRRYEHVRDVMNSWDNDAKNHLTIVADREVANNDDELDAKTAPKQQPGETTMYMYHSYRPGKWDKRWVSLRSEGQIVVAKTAKGPESTNACHLSDFDIYVPTQKQVSKKIKPPKKICFAVKSQQKSSMFLSGQNFVHFFATNDKAIASQWYEAVQSWRSWYLVNIMGEGQKKKQAQTTEQIRPATSGSIGGHSIDSIPYQLGSFKPLLNFELGNSNQNEASEPAASPSQSSPQATRVMHHRKMSLRDRAPPPTAFPGTSGGAVPSLRQAPTTAETDNSTFSSNGLLGRTYSQRWKAHQDREAELSSAAAVGPSMDVSTEQAANFGRKSSVKRTGSIRIKPKPLVDLTPTYQEPLHHARKGHGVAAAPGQQLVDVATGLPQEPGAIIVPNANTWRRPAEQADDRPSTARPRTGAGQQNTESDVIPFTGSGLLAKTSIRRAQGGRSTGQGVATGDPQVIGKPLVDLQFKSNYEEGSLLRQVEQHECTDVRGLLIDREHRNEADVKFGEGV